MNNKIILLLAFSLGTVTTFLFAQTQTVGLQKSSALVSDGYTLFSPQNNTSVYLIDNCGEKINQWTFNEKPALTCYLLENGNILRAGKDSLEIRDWNNNQIWSYSTTANGFLQHHDIHPLPNGNILCVCTDTYTGADAIAAGRQPSFSTGNVRFERIVELQPVGANSANLVWEWKFFDHLIQDFDSTKANYGVVENHPELLDVNFQTANLTDWLHVNSVSHNPDLDQIILSVRHINEVMIIDHSTTTAQAASHLGGTSNKGGDFLWRWGNPQVYRQGTATDQKLFLQHDAKFVPSSYVDSGKISVFNNGIFPARNYSSVDLILPTFSNNAYAMANGKFLPLATDYSLNLNVFGDTVYEANKSGFQAQENGNVLFCRSSNGQVSEFTKTGEHLWSYRNPTGTGPVIFNQFDVNLGLENTMFRAERYPSDYPAFVGKDMSPQGIIENTNAESASCSTLDIANIGNNLQLIVSNPIVNNKLTFLEYKKIEKLELYDMKGQLVASEKNFEGENYPLNLDSGTYLLRIFEGNKTGQQKIVIL